MNRNSRWLAILVVAAIAAIWRTLPEDPEGTIAGRASVRDGDSIVISGRRIRLRGIDAPEQAQTCGEGDATWPCGSRAEAHLGRLIANRVVSCEYFTRDRYGRYIAECEVGEVNLGAAMVRDGMAVDLDGRHAAAEEEARVSRRGLWQGPFLRPAVWRRRNPRQTD